MKIKYFIKYDDLEEIEVSKEKFMSIERGCGFYPKVDGETATGGFVFNKKGLKIKTIIKRISDNE